MKIHRTTSQKRVSFALESENAFLLDKLRAYLVLHKNQHPSKDHLLKRIFASGLAQILTQEGITPEQLNQYASPVFK